MIRQHRLPEARLEGQLVISPLTRSGPDQTEKWAEKVYALLPRIHLTQLLEEVDGWTHFSKVFTQPGGALVSPPLTEPVCSPRCWLTPPTWAIAGWPTPPRNILPTA